MKNKPLILLLILTFSLTYFSKGQVGIGTETPDSLSTLENSENSIDFNSIQQNLLDQTGKNTIDEAVQYYNLGIHFYEDKQYKASEKYLKQSLEIYKASKSNKKSSFSIKSKSIRSSTQSLNVLDVNLALVDAYIGQEKTKLAYSLIRKIEKNNPSSNTILLKKLEVLQAHSAWQELYDLCLKLESKPITEAQKVNIANKKALAKVKLGIEDDLFDQEEDESTIVISFEENESNHERLSDIQVPQINSSNSGYSNVNQKQIQSLDYTTQNEIANIYQEKNDLEKELNIRESIAKDKKTNAQQKAKQKLEIGKILTKTKSNFKAKLSLIESLDLAKKANNTDLQKETLLKLIDLYKKDKDLNNQLKYYEQYRLLSLKIDSLNTIALNKSIETKSKNIEKLEAINNIQEKGKLYKKDQSLKRYESSLNADQDLFQKIIIACLTIGFLLLFIALLWYHKQRKIQKNINLQLELKNMRNQMNPHFIFNSLNAVNHFIAQKNELMANEYLTEFALLMRNTLNQSDLDLIPLSDELTFLKRYCELEKMRFESQFDFTFNIEPNVIVEQYKIPPLLLQPFVENAVWHGLRYLETKGELSVNFSMENDQLKVVISDNGIGRQKSESIKTVNQKKHKSKGVSLIKRRIDISNTITPTHIDWAIVDLEPQGTQVTLLISKPK